MVEARQTSVPRTGDLRRVVSKGKGNAAEGEQANVPPGQAKNICLTVAFAECYHGAAGMLCPSHVIVGVCIGYFLFGIMKNDPVNDRFSGCLILANKERKNYYDEEAYF